VFHRITNLEFRITVVFFSLHALVTACHGSPETQNIQDAIAHAQSGEPVACSASQ